MSGPSIVFNPQPKCEQPTPTAMDQPSAIVIEHDSSLESQLMSTSLPLTLPKEEDCELIQEFDIQLEFMDVDYNGGEYIIEDNQEEDQNQTYTEGDTSSLFLDENDSVDQAQEDDNEDHDVSEKSQSENGDEEYEEAELPSALFTDENDDNSEKSEDENGFEMQEQTPKRLPPILSKTVSPSGASSRYAYKCEQCPFGSTSKQRLDAHLVVHVKGSGAIPCPDCEWYILPHRMARHQSKAHRVPAQRVRKPAVKKKKVVAPPKPKPKSPPRLLLPPPPPVPAPVEVKVEPKPPVLKPAVKKKAEKPKSGYYYKCDRCPYSSSSVARYRTHEKTHEPGSLARPCPDCGVWTLPGRQLAFHQSKVHLIQGNKKKKRSPPKKVEEEVEEEMYSILQEEEEEEEVEVPLIPEQPQPSSSISIPQREPSIPSLFLVTADDQQVEKRWFHCPLCSFSTGNLELLEIHRQFHESAAEYEEDEHDDENNVQILGI
ncbi:putative zinc finger protein [Orchesella cincta]|uniref:Putative zinc finger protein n=1 Tax=Orchesella cincta TaxID=48709 RepID=A0A1D2M6A8_ORCCI|nr:putative zinc finger protein [Orchesella cincta]